MPATASAAARGTDGWNSYRALGISGLHDQSRTPHSSPCQTLGDVVALILEEHTRFGWGARKILKRLQTRDPRRARPSRSTIFDILARHNRVQRRRRRQHWKHAGAAPLRTTGDEWPRGLTLLTRLSRHPESE